MGLSIDREKVIKELEERIKVAEECMGNPMFTPDAIRTIVALLKEQDTVEHACDILRANGWKETEPLCSECDAVHVVRCMDCIWWHQSETNEAYGDCGQANGIALKPFDWFCADGERTS